MEAQANNYRPPNRLEDLRSPDIKNCEWPEDLVGLFEPRLTHKKKVTSGI